MHYEVIYCVSFIIYIGDRDFLTFEIRKNLDLRKIFVTPKIFLKSGFHCTHWLRHLLRLVAFIKIHADCAETADYAGIGQWAKLDLQSIQHRD